MEDSALARVHSKRAAAQERGEGLDIPDPNLRVQVGGPTRKKKKKTKRAPAMGEPGAETSRKRLKKTREPAPDPVVAEETSGGPVFVDIEGDV